MIISEKEKIILKLFFEKNKPLSIKEISYITKINERTIYRELKNLNISIRQEGLYIEKNKTKYFLKGNLKDFDFKILEENQTEQIYYPDIRNNLIICYILLDDAKSILELSEKINVSYNTISSSLNYIENILKDYKLELFKKKGTGIEIVGDELKKRTLLISIFCNEIKDNEFFDLLNNNLSNNIFIKFLDMKFLQNLYMSTKNATICKKYTDASIKKIFISINIAILRYNEKLKLKNDFIEDYIRAISEEFLEYCNNVIDIDFSDLNIYLCKILKTCKLIEQFSGFENNVSKEIIEKVDKLIENLSYKLNVNFHQDTSLIYDLTVHIESAIKRFDMNLKEENYDLLEFILENYNEIYLAVKNEIIEIFSEIDLNSTELSYIVLHFASSYEKIYRNSFIRALLICSSGIGSSKILGNLIRKNIPEIKNIEYLTNNNLNKDVNKKYDIVISTIPLDKDIDYLYVSTLLKQDDISNIKNKILEIRKFDKNKEFVNPIVYKKDIISESFLNVKNIVDNSFIININNKNDDFKENIELAFRNVKLNVNEKKLSQDLIERHKLSPIILNEKKLIFFHTLSSELDKPILIVCRLDSEIKIIENKIEYYFIMVSPDDKLYKELLSQLSIAIINDEIFFKSIISNNIDFFRTKIELIIKNSILNSND